MVSLTGSDRINLLTSHRSLPIVLSHSAIAQASARLSAYWRQLAVYQPLLASSFPCIALTANERQREWQTWGGGVGAAAAALDPTYATSAKLH